ncbi:MAG: hypothetical protein ACE368_15105 [Paracoccaceae bacterium]
MSVEELRGGRVGRAGLLTETQFAQAAEVLARVAAEGLETLRLSFVDQHGILRGKTLTPAALAGAFRDGVAMTSTLLLKDTSHRTVFPVWGDGPGWGTGGSTGRATC